MDREQYRFGRDGSPSRSRGHHRNASRLTRTPLVRDIAKASERVFVKALIYLIRAYQLFLSPFFGRHCRFYPSCSHYTAEALERHGPLIGLGLALHRISRCQPWGSSGYDPVPGKLHRLN